MKELSEEEFNEGIEQSKLDDTLEKAQNKEEISLDDIKFLLKNSSTIDTSNYWLIMILVLILFGQKQTDKGVTINVYGKDDIDVQQL